MRSVLVCMLLLGVNTAAQAQRDTTRILVAYHSLSGHTEQMARAVAAGANQVAGVHVVVKNIAQIERAEIAASDAVIVGSPTHWAAMTADVKRFIESWPDMVDKIGGVFATGGGGTGGKETVIVAIATAMLSHGMVVVGPVYREGEFRFGNIGASAVTGATDPGLGEAELAEARALGERVAAAALRWQRAAAAQVLEQPARRP